MIVCLVSIFRTPGNAAETNGGAFIDRPALVFPGVEPGSDLGLVKRYEQELLRHQGVMVDGFGPPSYLKWTLLFNREGYSIHDQINSSGARATAHFVADSMRETAVARLPLEEWNTFGQLLLGTIGNTAEERSQTISASFSDSQRLWRQELLQTNPIRYGVRPWRRDPYAYCGVRVGHWGGVENLPLFILEGRVGYKLFSSGKLEGTIAFPLAHRCQLVGGIATDPLRLASHNPNPTMVSGRLEYVFSKNRSTQFMYVGVQSAAHEFLLASGLEFAW